MHEKLKPSLSQSHLVCFADFKIDEVPSHIIAFASSLKKFTIVFLALYLIFFKLNLPFYPFIIIFSIGLIILKSSLVALKNFSKLDRLHKIIEDKKWHIEHKREEEKETLRCMYQTKGFEGKILDEIVNTLTSDDNRLMQTMLQEEMNLSLNYFIHPVKQAIFAVFGMALAFLLLLGFSLLDSSFLLYVIGFINVCIGSIILCKCERCKISKELTWDLAIGIVVILISYFLCSLFL